MADGPLKPLARVVDFYVPAAEIQARISAFQGALSASSLDGALIKQNADLYYLCGSIQDSYLYVPNDGEPILMVYRNRERAALESPLPNVEALPSLGKLTQILGDNGYRAPKRLGVEMDVLPAALFLNLKKIFAQSELVDVSFLLRDQRKIKSAYEIEQQRKAAAICHRMYEKAFSVLREGVTEVEAQGILEAEARRWGHPGPVRMRGFNQEMFYGHLISGPEAVPTSTLDSPTGGVGLTASFSHGPSTKRLRAGEPINVDLFGNFNGYLADQTRLFCIGDPGAELQRAYEASLTILETLASLIVPGLPIRDLFKKAHELAEKLGYGEYFMGLPGSRPKFIGHGVGLEADEFPFVTENNNGELEAGMVVALEPKLIIPDVGVIGIEDTMHVTEDKAESLTTSPRVLAVLPRT